MSATVYRNALLFDGLGNAPIETDLLVRDGIVAEMGTGLKVSDATTEVECRGLWLMPGLLDIHTHLDLEVELSPGLPEVVRHGTTTVVIGNCSIGVTYGNQRSGGGDPIVDCFARVENIPKTVLEKIAGRCTWTSSRSYLDHLDALPLGANVVPLLPHSMVRIEAMGLDGSISRKPDRAEMKHMVQLVETAMGEGYVGLSTDALPFHFLANAPHKKNKIPTQYAGFSELKRLLSIVRRHGRVWQATPPKDDVVAAVRGFLLTSSRLYGRPLRTTVLAALDLSTNRLAWHLCLLLSKILNSRAVGGNFHFQALSAPFRIWSDGAINPVADEVPELRALNELELDDRAGRLRIMSDPKWASAFRRMWMRGKSGVSLARLLRLLRLDHVVLTRSLSDMRVVNCPLPNWCGETLAEPYHRLLRWQASSGCIGSTDWEEELFFRTFPDPVKDDAKFLIHLLRAWDTDLRWETVFANRNPALLKKILFHPLTLPGFNDSGAHLANIAFYDGNLRTLKIAQEDGLQRVAQGVRRLTSQPAAFLDLDVGVLRVGAKADLCVIDPVALRKWKPEETNKMLESDDLGCRQMVNRPEGVVREVMVSGARVWSEGAHTKDLGAVAYGKVLRAGNNGVEKTI
ncbi:N-acyl-D-amino-acid deacylase family protein [Acetobacter conturbans]|uniref:N-acyl-D-glutamate deacylase n=1 Tax=Acetobacter conturbans TaxID=1737472 RepID=A0ABX0K304_9PROT|nr:N-acyl-D-glutamate deacylase [Acetobacter conturbans]NHN88698.1 N-acyl-D-glutamate deacylase [Acetobacter conturbans]